MGSLKYCFYIESVKQLFTVYIHKALIISCGEQEKYIIQIFIFLHVKGDPKFCLSRLSKKI